MRHIVYNVINTVNDTTIFLMKKRIYLSEAVIIDVFKLLNENRDIKKTEIAKKLQISRNTVHNAIKELKIKGWIVQNTEIHIIHKISEKK